MRTRISEIDLLRFLAAVAVMFMHYLLRGFAANDYFSPIHFASLGPPTRYNYLAVNLFFMISGFMILMSVHLKSTTLDVTSTSNLVSSKGFIVSRFIRLYPAFWFCCTLSFLLAFFLFNNIFHLSIPRYLLNMTMLNGFFFIGNIDGVYWTLCLELKFYLFMLLLLYLKHIQHIEKYLLGWTLLSILDFWLQSPVIKYLFITDFASFFISGCLFYQILKHGFSWLRGLLLGMNFYLGFLYESARLKEKITHYISLNFSSLTILFILISFYLAFLFILRIKNGGKSYDSLFSYLGRLSYPLYLIHANIGFIIFNLLNGYMNKYLLVGLTCLMMILLAHFINVLIEKPLSKYLKGKLSRWAQEKTT